MNATINGNSSKEEHFKEIEEKLAIGGNEHPNLFLLPECCLGNNFDKAESYDAPAGETFNHFSTMAKQYHAYVVAPFLTERDGIRYNSSVVFDRGGVPVFIYDKAFPTADELKCGVQAGCPSPDCFDADFGKIGFAICFDLNFRTLFQNYYRKGMELLFFSSYFPGGFILQSLAFEFSCFAVSSHSQGDESVFIDNFGREFARANIFEPALTRKIELDSTVMHMDANYEKVSAIKAKYGDHIEIEQLRPEGRMIIRSVSRSVTVKEIMKEFNLTALDDFLDANNGLLR